MIISGEALANSLQVLIRQISWAGNVKRMCNQRLNKTTSRPSRSVDDDEDDDTLESAKRQFRPGDSRRTRQQQCARIDGVIARRVEELANVLTSVVQRRRYGACMSVLRSAKLCQQNGAGFYIWANRLAKSIMAGNGKQLTSFFPGTTPKPK